LPYTQQESWASCICNIIIIIITRVSSQVHCAQSNKSTLVQDKQVTTRPSVTTTATASLGLQQPAENSGIQLRVGS
jgi:hypothetical protein